MTSIGGSGRRYRTGDGIEACLEAMIFEHLTEIYVLFLEAGQFCGRVIRCPDHVVFMCAKRRDTRKRGQNEIKIVVDDVSR